MSSSTMLLPQLRRLPVLALVFSAFQLHFARAQVRIVAPRNLKDEFRSSNGRIDGSTATFGAPFYGDSFLGRLVYGESKGELHCTDTDYDVPDPSEYTPPGKSYKEVSLIHIVLVERGGCSFVTKVKVARQKHAHAVIIIDKPDSKLTSKDIRNIIVADDGYGANINIPSVLISREDGQKLIDATKVAGSEVVVELAWDVPSQRVVMVDQWMDSASASSHKFLKAFEPKRAALNEYLMFVPHYHVFSLDTGKDYLDLCSDMSGRFCADDPDAGGPVTGYQVLMEDVRQLCIHELTAVAIESRQSVAAIPETMQRYMPRVFYSRPWWQYVSQYLDECPIDGRSDDPLHSFGPECSERVMKKVGGIDIEKVKECERNTKEEKLAYQLENSAWSEDALRINGWRYSGTMDADLVTKAICAGFIMTPVPCATLTSPTNPFHGEVLPVRTGGVTNSQMVEAFLILAVIAIGVMYFYKRSLTRHVHTALREEVMLEVQSQMSQYKQLGDL
mmetsp:Transcript_30715/g.57516  ORF Transcript_30715/g.57516 Transcript_30715/m.57516 type:complete len:504 (-) Transcript_30715:283-1794(-)